MPQPPANPAERRVCPVCGREDAARHCPDDGATTVRIIACEGTPIGMGTRIDGRLVITDVIGAGGFARVYGASDERTGGALAVKVMARSYVAADPDVVQRFVREAEITSRLTHGNTIRVYDVGQTEDGQLLLLMERLRGGTLTQRLRQLRHDKALMPIAEAGQIAVQILSSLTEAHAAGLVHRDLKPDNVFLHRVGAGGQIAKVIDFGIARSEGSEMTRVGQVLGTPAYMSPEQARGAPIDGRSDLYSVGVITFQCLTGRTPFLDEDNPLMTMMHHVMTPVPDIGALRPELDPALAAVVTRALAKEPDQRFASAAEMRLALRQALGGATTTAVAVPTSRPSATTMTRRMPRSAADVVRARTYANLAAVVAPEPAMPPLLPGHGDDDDEPPPLPR